MKRNGLNDNSQIDITLLIAVFLAIVVGLLATAWSTKGFVLMPSTKAPISTNASPSLK